MTCDGVPGEVEARRCRHTPRKARNAVRLGFRARYARAIIGLQLGDAGGVIGMMMRDEDVVETPVAFRQRRLDGCRVRRVDRGRLA